MEMLKSMDNITKFYKIQIELGRITIDQIPNKYRESVRKAIEESSKWWLFLIYKEEYNNEDSYKTCEKY